METRDIVEQEQKDIVEFHGKHDFLSNFYPVDVVWDGKIYPTVEHAYQAAKTTSSILREAIRCAPTPGAAKKAGRNIVLRKYWDSIKNGVMFELLRRKFMQNEEMAKKLLATGFAYLAEGNTWGDNYWGICNDRGENWLGKLLMEIRSELHLKSKEQK